jgi:hypothetical protein
MAETKGDAPAGNPDPERMPFMQRLLDNPFLLLFLGVTIPTVFHPLGVMELTGSMPSERRRHGDPSS